jgi:hypothetical protein
MCAALILVAACDSPTAPSADVTGDWDFNFSAFDQRSCPVDAGLMRGCAGSGRLAFPATTPTVNATHSYRASCQSCERAADYGVFEQPLRTARLTGGVLEFTLAACRFTTTIPAAPAQTIAGTVVCRPNEQADQEVSGTWTMFRP